MKKGGGAFYTCLVLHVGYSCNAACASLFFDNTSQRREVQKLLEIVLQYVERCSKRQILEAFCSENSSNSTLFNLHLHFRFTIPILLW